MNGKLCCVIVLSLVCGACTNAARTLPTPEPTPIFIDGKLDVPPGKYILARYERKLVNSGGYCPVFGPVRSGVHATGNYGDIDCKYRGDGGKIEAVGRCKGPDDHLWLDRSPIKGFFSAWEDASNVHFTVLHTLPYTVTMGPQIGIVTDLRSHGIVTDLDSREVVIHSVNWQGEIVTRMCGQTRLIEPGQTVTVQRYSTFEDPSFLSCYWTTTCRFTNLGLQDDRQIKVIPIPDGSIFVY